ncbi:hypothetical protein EV144_101267 [Flavobacterium sp. 270]|uniref:hypothetical protein n=1 Tax=Flavobacterium sp. 270 TaxID=2512114 RepID=UPI001066A558|nr:hypothetical protein [Flavobacterium sp. 270]TDW51591.1 hypothetical protein EV144_101267 [Flavobacterium sp. 270]
MKSQNKKILFFIFHFLYLFNLYAQNDINKFFFNLPLEASRDTIYSSIKKYGFLEEKKNRTVLQDDCVIKTFYGYLDAKTATNILPTADSIKIQLSLGSISSEIDKYYQNLLIIESYYHFSNPQAAKIFYRDKKIEIEKINAKKTAQYNNLNTNIKTRISDKLTDTEDYTEASIAFKRERPGYIIIILEYQRSEGEKKLKPQFITKKELVVRDIDCKNLFRSNNVEQLPVTRKCSNKNNKSLQYFKESIKDYLWNDVNFDDFNLTPERQQIALNFIITKNNEIINIKVSHPNKKLCEEVMQSINRINIIEPAMNKGIKVDYLAEIPIIFSISN